jgi:hypothetical protein
MRNQPPARALVACWRVLAHTPQLILLARQQGVASLPEGLTWDLLLDALKTFFKLQVYVLAARSADDLNKDGATEAGLVENGVVAGHPADALCDMQPWIVALLTVPDVPQPLQPRKRKVFPYFS